MANNRSGSSSNGGGSRTFVVSFYSYKGGVGRSIALLNVANQLALRGRSVVMIDFDLEAPGLHSAVTKIWEEAETRLQESGMIDYFADYEASGQGGAEMKVPDFRTYLSRGFGLGDRIRLMTAGNLSDPYEYSKRLAQLNIVDFAEKWYGRELLLQLRKDIAADECDYLLIDSRTGFTDALGATTVLLPHAVVLLTNLSEQSLDGTKQILDLIHRHGTQEGRKSRADDDFPNLLCARDRYDPDIETLVVASPMPFGDQAGLRKAAQTIKRSADHIIYYVPRIDAHEEEHVIKDTTQGRRSQSAEVDPAFRMYSKLVDKIEALNPYEPRNLAELGQESLERQDWRVALGYFRSAECFLHGNEDDRGSLSDRKLQVRLWLGKARALAIGYQTTRAGELIEKAAAAIEELKADQVAVEHVDVDFIRAQMQLVRGLFGSDKLHEALVPAEAARETARRLPELSGKPDKWQIVTGLMAADAKMLGEDYAGAAEEAMELPQQARRLNRRVEMVRALQVQATALLNIGHIKQAKVEAERAVKEAEDFDVDYLTAEAHLVAAQVELAAGTTSGAGRERLDKAASVFREIGDGYGEAYCLSELGLYRHRLGEDVDAIRRDLRASIHGYQQISGTSLGEVTDLLYATRVLLDRGLIDFNEMRDTQTPMYQHAPGEQSPTRPALTPSLISKELSRATDTLMLATFIALGRGVSQLNELIDAYWRELALFAQSEWLDYVKKELNLVGPPSLGSSTRLPAIALEVERSRLLDELLKSPVEDITAVEKLQVLATKARESQAIYDEACTLTLLALAHYAAGKDVEQDLGLVRLQDLHENPQYILQWTMWGHVRAIRDDLQDSIGGTPKKWRSAASTLLKAASELGLPVPP